MRTNRIRSIGSTAMAALLVVSIAGCPATTIVVINDEVLDAAIREDLGHPLGFLTRADLLTLHTLDVRELDIRNLSGLEYCTNLTFLDLSGNPISDITPLSSLVNLQSLNLDGTDVYDISALAGLTNLDSVSLCGSLITDIQALVTNSVNGGLTAGDFVNLTCGSLGDQAESTDIPFLEGEGVNVVCCDDSESQT